MMLGDLGVSGEGEEGSRRHQKLARRVDLSAAFWARWSAIWIVAVVMSVVRKEMWVAIWGLKEVRRVL